MFDWVPLRAWLLLALTAIAYTPALYLYRHITHSPSGHDITQPPVDLSWRTPKQLARNTLILVAAMGFAIFIFTPAAAEFAASPSFLPLLMTAAGAWAISSVTIGLAKGQVEPFIRGFDSSYEREKQPKRFWVSICWNALVGCLCLWLAYNLFEQSSAEIAQDQCYDESSRHSPQTSITACNKLMEDVDSSDDELANLIAARGVAFHRLGDHRRAISDYSKAIRLDPADYHSRYNRGLLYQQLGDNTRAAEDFSAAIGLQPNDPEAYFYRGLAFLDTGRLDEAVADLTRAHEANPRDPWPLANRGLVFALKEDQARAEKDLQAVRAIDATNPVLLRGEALLSMNKGDMDTAVDRLSAGLRQEPNNTWLLRKRAEAYWELGEHEKSAADDDKMLRLMSNRATK